MLRLIAAAFITLLLAACSAQEPPICGGHTDLTDPDAPKSVSSTEITSFRCYVNVMGLGRDYPQFTEWSYTFSADLEKDGGELMSALQSIVSRYDLAQFNGISRYTAGLPDNFGIDLEVRYASGECIRAADNQDMLIPAEAAAELVELFRGGITYTSITMDEAAALMAERGDWVLIDVRTEEEYDEGHLKGAYLIPLDSIGSLAADSPFPRGQLMLIYCRSGRRSKLAAEELCRMGYTNVVEIGGIIDWKGEIEK